MAAMALGSKNFINVTLLAVFNLPSSMRTFAGERESKRETSHTPYKALVGEGRGGAGRVYGLKIPTHPILRRVDPPTTKKGLKSRENQQKRIYK